MNLRCCEGHADVQVQVLMCGGNAIRGADGGKARDDDDGCSAADDEEAPGSGEDDP
jgi:hypothetical protein